MKVKEEKLSFPILKMKVKEEDIFHYHILKMNVKEEEDLFPHPDLRRR